MNSMSLGNFGQEQAASAAPVDMTYRAANSLDIAMARMKAEEAAKTRAYYAPAAAVSVAPVQLATAISAARLQMAARQMQEPTLMKQPGITVTAQPAPTMPVAVDPNAAAEAQKAVDFAVQAIMRAAVGNPYIVVKFANYFNQRIQPTAAAAAAFSASPYRIAAAAASPFTARRTI